ncbi:haloacid dehalogenase [Clostridium polyendosporum]|uniref:Haloacid dehalogenase n=1 Tax=Clostridium polyendosporum TaxID=69208 RepID=A0A919VG73_9CLOT|nr:HAD family phosphatase [Clostridium polyendosporum]GIM28306.1 haloacid dehalogenase [Clostridium polyendosporum]
MLNNIKAAIFDLDGTLIDSMWVWEQIDVDYLKNKGYDKPKNLKEDINHLSFEQTAIYFKNTFNIKESVEEIMNEWFNMAFDHYENNVKLKSGAKEFLLKLRKSGIKIALATSNSNSLLQCALKSNGIYEFFDVITTTGEVERGKNFPDVYLLTAKKLNVEPENCIVFEDILAAIQGAKAAGMKVVGVYDEAAEHQKEEIINLADRFIESYDNIEETAV